nr:hypothetical protein [Methylomarinum sp. Ch1-1]MDP4521547.1 hypothetical protein [Methylomarinum sp. Ch1-1]
MHKQNKDAFIRHVMMQHLAHLLPREIAEYLEQQDQLRSVDDDLATAIEDWNKKISVQSYWQGVFNDYEEKNIKLCLNAISRPCSANGN